jgi:hypothetical protein
LAGLRWAVIGDGVAVVLAVAIGFVAIEEVIATIRVIATSTAYTVFFFCI